MVKAGTLALASLSAVQATVSQSDLDAFPGFVAAMLECGSSNDWNSYEVTNKGRFFSSDSSDFSSDDYGEVTNFSFA